MFIMRLFILEHLKTIIIDFLEKTSKKLIYSLGIPKFSANIKVISAFSAGGVNILNYQYTTCTINASFFGAKVIIKKEILFNQLFVSA